MSEVLELFPACPMDESYCHVAVMARKAMQEFDAHQDFQRTISDPLPVIKNTREHLESTPCRFVDTGQCEAASYLFKSLLSKAIE